MSPLLSRKIFEYNLCKSRNVISVNSDLILKTSNLYTDFDMDYCGGEQVDKVVAETKEYNMWADDIWRDMPRTPNRRDEWVDMPSTSPTKRSYKCIPLRPSIYPQESYTPPGSYTPPVTPPEQPAWMPPSPKSTPPNSSPEFQWKTPEKCKNPSLEDLDTSPRTSTPVCNESQNTVLSENASQYECFKVHLHESPKKLKVRGSVSCENETIIAGHIDMKNLDPFSYTYEQYYMPKLNQCFVNLLINGPAPLMCHEHYDPNFSNHFVANCHCIPVCNCRVNLATNRNLPIGYKYDEHGFVVPTMPSLPPRAHIRNPYCIYTA